MPRKQGDTQSIEEGNSLLTQQFPLAGWQRVQYQLALIKLFTPRTIIIILVLIVNPRSTSPTPLQHLMTD